MTPGREIDEPIIEVDEKEYHVTLTTEDYDEIAILLLEALGGVVILFL